MIEATRIKTNDKDGCQVEASGSIGDLMMEYKAITEALFKTVSREAGLGLAEELFMKAIRMTIINNVSPVPDDADPVQEERGRNEISNISCSRETTGKGESQNRS